MNTAEAQSLVQFAIGKGWVQPAPKRITYQASWENRLSESDGPQLKIDGQPRKTKPRPELKGLDTKERKRVYARIYRAENRHKINQATARYRQKRKARKLAA